MTRVLLIAALAAGCAKNATAELQQFADRACACSARKDTACAKTVLADFMTFMHDTKHAKGDEAKTAHAARRMGECLLAAGVSSAELTTALRTPKPEENPAPTEAPEPASDAAK